MKTKIIFYLNPKELTNGNVYKADVVYETDEINHIPRIGEYISIIIVEVAVLAGYISEIRNRIDEIQFIDSAGIPQKESQMTVQVMIYSHIPRMSNTASENTHYYMNSMEG